MMVPGVSLLLALVDHVLVDDITTPDDCLSAAKQCTLDPDCNTRFHTLKQCAANSGVGSLQPAARNDCMIAAFALQSHQLFTCKCKRGMKKEKNCLRIFWTMHQSHIPGYNEFDTSPYEYSMWDPSWYLDYGRLASLVSEGTKVQPPASVNHCLDAAKACNVDENCKQFRTDYAKNCLKPASKFGCNRHKCHKSLRRFFDHVPEEYKYPVLFCPCEDSRCAERRRQTIVPACSFEESEKQNCLKLQDMCKEDIICKSRLVDFQTNCQPSKKSASYCFRENYNACLQSYTGLIGTILTPNYVSNISSDVSIWCTCANSGNQHEECENLLSLFTSNNCLGNSINWYTSSALFRTSNNEYSVVTTTQQLSFNFPEKDEPNNDASPLVKLDTNKDCDRGGKLKASQEKSMSEKITDCNANSGSNTQSLSLIISHAITSLYIFIAIVENAI
ncbi:GDNF family receptor alpha-4-like [Pristis pectinata]|uniref:GDNF family receptor alpha-4-like n=1 Tax=Pristis pectinata TaxID=685728 RepID=UPI00223DBC42|nr:GDNF family receptor alpha-4-like [Pristis pectinata]